MTNQSLQEVCCCMGQPVAGNPMQYMMQKAFQRADLDWCYLTFDVPSDRLEDALRGFRAFEFRGGHILLPHHRAATQYVDELTDPAAICGAINCVTRIEDRLVGDNTIGVSLHRSLSEMIDLAGKQVVLLGAGMVARAIGLALVQSGADSVTVVNRNEEHARELVELLERDSEFEVTYNAWEGDYRIPRATDLLIHATSIGLGDPETPVPVDLAALRPECVVADVVPSPAPSALLDSAMERGCRTLNGLDMLVNQGIIAFEHWTGVAPDALEMREAVEEFLSM